MKKIRVIHIIYDLGFGGAEKAVYDLSRFASPEEFDVSVLMIGDDKGRVPYFEKVNIPVHFVDPSPIKFRPYRIPYRLWEGVNKLVELNAEKKIDVIHAHMSYAAMLATLAKLKLPHLKTVFSPHNFNLESKRDELIFFLTKKWRDMDVMYTKAMHKKIYREDAVCIPNGIHTKQYELELPKFDRFTFLCIGRLDTQKNQPALIKAAKELVDKGYDFEVLMIGEGPHRSMLEEQVADLGLQDHITFMGVRMDIPKLCNQGHTLVICSRWEGLPNVLLEAAASSLPIITTKVGSVPELLDHENLGYLIPDNSELAKKMMEVIDNYEEAEQKGKRFHQKLKKEYDIEVVTQQYEQLYTTLATS